MSAIVQVFGHPGTSAFWSLSGGKRTSPGQVKIDANGRVEMWRGGCRLNISVAAPFVWRCLNGSTMAPFPHPAHRTGQADLPHPALGQDFTPSLSRATPSAVSEHSSELIGCPISRSFTTYCVCLELRSLPSTGVTRLPRYYEPLRHPRAPGLSLTGVRLVIADHALGLPVFRALSLCTCCRHYPGAASGRTASLISPSRISLPRKGCRVGLRIVLFEDCSAFTRVAACTLALSPIRDTLIEGFSHFVTSMTAPIASGWSGCRVGLAPTGKRRLSTAHTQSGHRPATDMQSRSRFQPLSKHSFEAHDVAPELEGARSVYYFLGP